MLRAGRNSQYLHDDVVIPTKAAAMDLGVVRAGPRLMQPMQLHWAPRSQGRTVGLYRGERKKKILCSEAAVSKISRTISMKNIDKR
ncbi:hypothetical protein E2C01_043647 [Portunus trituberculatus]|uniref:Uncharacterized protein n=1 Tax=Portunus trituberculatus TaxID=210409 RepID=A0A5B7FTH3_PORTR|nr:hypothetical protein [Portunus trituberculatus]